MEALEVFWAAPPVSRTLAAAAFVTSAAVYAHVLPGSWVIFHRGYIFMLPPQLWRLLTSFLVTGPGFGILLDPYFLYTYGSQLETDSPRLNQPGDMAVYVAFVCTVILALNATVMGGFIFTQSLVLALAYTYSQDNPDKKMSYFIATFRVKWLPYVMLLMTLFMSSPDVAMIQGSGLVAAHLYDFLTRIYPAFGGGRNFLKTPSAVKRFFGGDAGRRPVARGYGTAFAGQPTAAQPASGASTGFSSGWAGISVHPLGLKALFGERAGAENR